MTSSFYSNVVCPICNTENRFEVIKKGAYTVSELDTDFMPLGIKWADSKLEGINPLVYFIATCPACHYSAELNEKFKDWQRDNHFRSYRLGALKEKHLADLNNPNGLVRTITSVIDPIEYPNETAICKLLLAIFDETMNTHPSHLTLARYYLRVGWLLRSLKSERPLNEENRLVGLIRLLDDHLQIINKDIASLCQSTKTLASFYHDNANELFSTSLNQYFMLLNDILSSTENARAQISQLRGMNRGLLANRPQANSEARTNFKQYPNFMAFLQTLRNILPSMPENEMDSLKSSRAHYKQCLDIGRELKDGAQSLQAFYLIGELSFRIGEYDEAKKYLNSTINKGRAYINDRNNSDSEIAKTKPIVEKSLTRVRETLKVENEPEVVVP